MTLSALCFIIHLLSIIFRLWGNTSVYMRLHTLTHRLTLWLKQLAASTKIEYNIYISTLKRGETFIYFYIWLSLLPLLLNFSPFSPSLLQALVVIPSSDSDAAPQFQGTLQAWRVAAAAISGENNCVLKVDVTTSTCEAITARAVTAVEMNQINRLWLMNQFSWIRNVRLAPSWLFPLSLESLQRMKTD